jgi:hypothetical protein
MTGRTPTEESRHGFLRRASESRASGPTTPECCPRKNRARHGGLRALAPAQGRPRARVYLRKVSHPAERIRSRSRMTTATVA